MLQLIVLGHEVGKHFGEVLDLRGQLELLDEAVRVLLKLLWFQFLVGEQLINALVELLDFLAAFLVLPRLVAAEVLEQDLRGQLAERRGENVRLELEELVNDVLVLHRVKDVRGESDHIL